jgi:predicted ATPase
LDNWGIWPRHTQLVLNSLSDQDTLAMTADLLGAKKLDRDLRELVLRNTRGVPFFVEEFMGFLNNLKIIDKKGGKCHLVRDVREMTVPCTIQDLIISRINSLPASATEVLLAGSVAGRQFDYQLIARITALPDYELMSRLSILRYSGFLYERGVCPQSTYVFKHALIQDASYRLLSEEDRRSYHLKIAEELEQRSPEVIREDPGKLGHHLAEGGLREQAVQYWQKAADIAIRRSANHEAIHHLRTALETVKTLPETPERTRRELELQIALGPALMAIKGYAAPEVKSVYSRARNLCERLDETPQLYTILRGLWGFFIVRSELEAAHRLGERCLAIARRTKKPPLVLWAHYALGMTLFHMGEFARALEHLEKGVELYDVRKRQSQRALQDPGVACFSYRALALWMLGYPDQALKTSRNAVALADSLSHPFSRAYALSLGAMVNQFCGRVQEVREQAEVSEALCTKHGISYWFAWGPILQGWTLIAQGQGDEGIKQILLGLAAYSATGAEIARPLFLVILADAYRREGKVSEGLACVTEGLDRAHNTWDRFCEPELHRLKGELILAMSPHDRTEAEACFRKALDISRQRKAKSFELRAATSLSRLLQGCGKDLEARELLAEAYGWFTEGLDSRDLKDARAMLDRMV